MKFIKNISMISCLAFTSFCINQLKPMESATSLHDTCVQEILQSTPFDISGPSQLLDSIKALQAKNFPPKAIADALKVYFKSCGESLYTIHQHIPISANVFYFLDETCNRDTVSILLYTFDKEKDACQFITMDLPSALDRTLRNGYYECTLPMMLLLWKNGMSLDLIRPGHMTIRYDIQDMATKTRKKLESCIQARWNKLMSDEEITFEEVLLAVAKKLRKKLNADPSKSWFELA